MLKHEWIYKLKSLNVGLTGPEILVEMERDLGSVQPVVSDQRVAKQKDLELP